MSKKAVGYLIILCVLFFSVVQSQTKIVQKKGVIEMSNQWVKARFTSQGMRIQQDYFSKKEGKWALVVSSFDSPKEFPTSAPQLFNDKLDIEHRFLASNVLQTMVVDKENNRVKLLGKSEKNTFVQYVSLPKDQRYFHIETEAVLSGSPVRLDYFLSTFTFNLNGIPSFIHTPGLKFDNEDSKQNRFKLLPAQDQIIGDRAFHAPAVILQEKGLFAALVPDLNAINKYAVVSPDARRTIDIGSNMFSVPIIDSKYTMPTGLDLNVQSGLTPKPVFTFGFMDNIIAHHTRYQRTNDKSMIRTLNSNRLKYAFDLFIDAQANEHTAFQQVSQHQWKKYGQEVFRNHPHLTMPFESYFKIVDSITFRPSKYPDIDIPLKGYEDHGSWLQFDMNGVAVGGYRSAINWWNDVIHNSDFWNNARDASGFWFWGKQLNRPDMMDKAHRIINFCLQAPRNEHGLFATLYNANDKTWGLQFSDPPHGKNQFFLRKSDSYEITAMSKTGAHLLDYYLRCEKDERIVEYLKPYANWLITAIDSRGAVPSYVTTQMEQSPILRYSAHPAASMWFLAAMYNTTKENKYRDAAEKIAQFLEKEILPEQKWIDMEQYYSDGLKPLAFERDVIQHQIARGNLSTIWASEGFAQLYTATGNTKYLKEGESCIDYLSFSQCSWNPHFIYTAFPFGGFTADNSDNATMLDARQAETVKPYIWYGKMLGRQDLIERGVAAARSSAVLMNLPTHKVNGIYEHTNIYPFGLGPENIDHEAHPQSAMRTSPSWGEGSGIFTGLAEAYRELQGGYIDFDKKIAVGVNGIVIKEASLKEKVIYLSIKNTLSDLKMPWTKIFNIQLKVQGLKKGLYEVFINGKNQGELNSEKDWILTIYPDGKIEIKK